MTTTNAPFLVRQSRTFNLVLAVVFLGIAMGAFFSSGGDVGALSFPAIFVVLALCCMVTGIRNARLMEVSHKGFFRYGTLVTDWAHFDRVWLKEEDEDGDGDGRFVLYLRYFSPDFTLLHTRGFTMSNTQDKGDEEIIAAIEAFHRAHVEASTKEAAV